MIYLIVGIAVIVAAILVFEPKLDQTKDGNLLLWFNKDHERTYYKIW